MKLKYYLRGIGIGIVVTTVILMIVFAVHREQPLSDGEIIKRAEELGMVMADDLPSGDKLSDPKTTDGTPQDQQQTGEDQTDGGASTEVQNEPTDQSEHEAAADDQNAGQPEPEVVELKEITIVGGEYSDDVCKKLKKAGVIEDADDFNKYLAKNGYDNLIQPGNYEIPIGADYDSIIKIITEKKTTKKR